MTDDFRFDESTARVFDDMLERSVPFYAEMQRMTVELHSYYFEPSKIVVHAGQPVELIHFDLYRMSSSQEFLEAGFREHFNQRNICRASCSVKVSPLRSRARRAMIEATVCRPSSERKN